MQIDKSGADLLSREQGKTAAVSVSELVAVLAIVWPFATLTLATVLFWAGIPITPWHLWAALALSPEEKMGVDDVMEMEKRADALPVERAASRWIVSTDPDEHVEKIAPYIELGFKHLVFHAPGTDQPRFLRLYAEQVLPRLRERFG